MISVDAETTRSSTVMFRGRSRVTEPVPRVPRGLRIAVVVPCFDEAGAIAQVIADCRAALPGAAIHVFDNRSTDGTAAVARAHGAHVTRVTLRGKGNVVRRMFADVEAEFGFTVDDVTEVAREVAAKAARSTT